MATGKPKRYYWLKLKDDFFNQKEIKRLRKIAGGDTYTIIYLKMLLVSLKNEGKIYFDGIEEDFASEIALELDEDEENVKVTLAYLRSKGLVEMDSEDEMTMQNMASLIGSETESAVRMRRSRSRKASLSDGPVTRQLQSGYTEIEKEIDIEIYKPSDDSLPPALVSKVDTEPIKKKVKQVKHKHGEYNNVLLTDEELEKLKAEYSDLDDRIERLSSYIASTGKVYKSHYATIRNWARKDKEQPKQQVRYNQPRAEVVPDWLGKQYKEQTAPSGGYHNPFAEKEG
ncbi:phage replisome organizer N-terminal domain-containing protein [Abiotrophia defectiva]|uniref:phage replisome organizer N-terminal domain-containing protein n=1 Tax=Abiotrophia defectiva TaxID=46125 RepID=UPI0026F2F666|nr:phage replisome organizer N-terminal domain-containing protein [Abiotrophia defectiva]